MKMDKFHAYKILVETIDKYLSSEIKKCEIPSQLNFRIAVTDAAESEDMLLTESFFTLFHIDEYGCDAPDEELQYLRDCLVGERTFTRLERDEIVTRASNQHKQ